jgi:hypothetical protein
MELMCDIPIEIAEEEKIVRAIMSGHLNKNGTRLTPRAFRSRPAVDEVSVIRHTYKGSDFCKAKGREVAAKAGVQQFRGLAVLLASQIRKVGSGVNDSREEFCGHAHISHGILQPPPNEPPSAREILELDKKLGMLRDAALYCPDPDPESEGWTGAEL